MRLEHIANAILERDEFNAKEHTIEKYTGKVDSAGKPIFEGDTLQLVRFEEECIRPLGKPFVVKHGKYEFGKQILMDEECVANVDIDWGETKETFGLFLTGNNGF